MAGVGPAGKPGPAMRCRPPARLTDPQGGVAQSEQAFQVQVKALARACGWLVYHTPPTNRAEAGFPDLVLIRDPHLLFVELKSPKGRVRPEQTLWLDSIAACPGPEAYIWRPADWPAIVDALTSP